MSKNFPGIFCLVALLYVLCASGEVWIIEDLKGEFNVEDLVIFESILINSYWPLQLGVYLLSLHAAKNDNKEPTRKLSLEQVRNYSIIGLNVGIVTVFKIYAINALPGSMYVVIANSELVFTSIFSVGYLKLKLNRYQMLSVVLALSAMLCVAFDTESGGFKSKNKNGAATVHGIAFALLSRMLSSFNSVLAQKLLGKDKKSRWGVMELSLFNSLIPSIGIPFVLFFKREHEQWGAKFGELKARSSPAKHTLALLLLTLLPLSKFLDRLSKFTIISRRGSIFFSVLDSVRKCVVGLGSAVFFHEPLNWMDGVGYGLMVASFFADTMGGKQAKSEKQVVDDKEDIEYTAIEDIGDEKNNTV